MENDKEYSEASSGAESVFFLRWQGEEDSSIKPKWLVKNMLPETGAGLLSGQWGTFKTSIAIDLAGSVRLAARSPGIPSSARVGCY
jgi:AAA domain